MNMFFAHMTREASNAIAITLLLGACAVIVVVVLVIVVVITLVKWWKL